MLTKSPEPAQNPSRQQKFRGSVSLSRNRKGRFIHVRTAHNLDLTNVSLFNDAAKLARANPGIRKVVVDLGLTQQVFDSGKAMLLLLRNQLAPALSQKVLLINAEPEMAHQLSPYC
jgi:hypothetical protein